MNARDRRRKWAAAAAAMIGSTDVALAQGPGAPAGRVPVQTKGSAPATAAAANKPEAKPEGRFVRIPANPTDAVAIVNGEPITRQQLADEAVTRKGEEVLDALVSRKIIDQAVKKRGVVITQQDIDKEIDNAAATMGHGASREQWLALLSKERKISPAQYRDDIIYPGLALRRLAENASRSPSRTARTPSRPTSARSSSAGSS
jgi:hypothetical protein